MRTSKTPVPAFRIDDIPVTLHKPESDHTEFILALKKLEVGQSFVHQKLTNNYFNTITTVGIALGRSFAARKQPDGTHRVGRMG